MGTAPLDVAAEGIPEDVWGQSLFLLDDADWLIAVPLSPWAARWWGRFTEWCTAETLPCFWEYNDKGPLIVFCSRPEGRRWQLHPVTGEFRDENNKAVSWRRFLGRYPAVMGAVANVLRTQCPAPTAYAWRRSRLPVPAWEKAIGSEA